ncbi:hypothetical protein CBM2633_P50005 [Cupriavidus taiwanensis]|uniref:Uncharacterized protein n=2 Tax=Cupriavidus TaxID=106589 RepID=A0A375CPT8_9BURK|nr:hypothetical protein CBM2588_P60005 [Cupriavidus taiwanensis]SOZ40743.1 hypothetical protein CBM2605_P50005 [Cupriavidus neocaledonicus]SOY76795.1 hypothetical protein CBM2585_P50005 [Cupriavidus taiwanensis]SOY76802.1 hypothetical protein CBM2592_P70005 [Cupriavidus taiwanensis]SOY77198.1 hypothetical protein CBM2589_P50005 [Cupriavidus taiwanensis]
MCTNGSQPCVAFGCGAPIRRQDDLKRIMIPLKAKRLNGPCQALMLSKSRKFPGFKAIKSALRYSSSVAWHS